jgi:hypothetical protein
MRRVPCKSLPSCPQSQNGHLTSPARHPSLFCRLVSPRTAYAAGDSLASIPGTQIARPAPFQPLAVFPLGSSQCCSPPSGSWLRQIGERAFVPPKLPEPLHQVSPDCRSEPVPNLSYIDQLVVFVAANLRASNVLGFQDIPADHELLIPLLIRIFLPGTRTESHLVRTARTGSPITSAAHTLVWLDRIG